MPNASPSSAKIVACSTLCETGVVVRKLGGTIVSRTIAPSTIHAVARLIFCTNVASANVVIPTNLMRGRPDANLRALPMAPPDQQSYRLNAIWQLETIDMVN